MVMAYYFKLNENALLHNKKAAIYYSSWRRTIQLLAKRFGIL